MSSINSMLGRHGMARLIGRPWSPRACARAFYERVRRMRATVRSDRTRDAVGAIELGAGRARTPVRPRQLPRQRPPVAYHRTGRATRPLDRAAPARATPRRQPSLRRTVASPSAPSPPQSRLLNYINASPSLQGRLPAEKKEWRQPNPARCTCGGHNTSSRITSATRGSCRRSAWHLSCSVFSCREPRCDHGPGCKRTQPRFGACQPTCVHSPCGWRARATRRRMALRLWQMEAIGVGTSATCVCRASARARAAPFRGTRCASASDARAQRPPCARSRLAATPSR